ncbi:hypothetical protein LUZ60_006875 [Juncus effusus]|nr:hypothetical protein LUZ60_006875 [Juncus effusus]
MAPKRRKFRARLKNSKMGTECVSTVLNHDSDPAIPPGFGPFISNPNSNSASYSACDNSNSASCSGNENNRKSRRNRRSVDYSQFDTCSDEYSQQYVSSARNLPKGVIRGCANCANCQKVIARWKPESSCRPALDEAPVFYPTEEEFKDTLKYIESIRPLAEPFGICRIVPPNSWRPPCILKQKSIYQTSNFSTRIQRIDKLQNRESSKKITTMNKRRKVMNGSEEGQNGNFDGSFERFGFEPGPEFSLEGFEKFADEFKREYFGGEGKLGFEPSFEEIEGEYWRIVEKPTSEIEVLYGADLETKSFASGFPKQNDPSSPSISNSPESEGEYVNSGWNLNNFPKLPGSVLAFESGDISGVLVPWLYVGMCFSSFCWHVEDHHLYSLNYMHFGAPKMWYGVSGNDASKLEASMRNNLPDLFDEQPDLLHNLVTQFSPSRLKRDGISVYRCVQREGEFVLTLPRAYHAGFNTGFNCAEAVNVAPLDWLPHGQFAVELYREQGRKISVSHDKLLLGAAREAVRAQWEITFKRNCCEGNLRWKGNCGPNSVLARTLKARIAVERERRENRCNTTQPTKLPPHFDSTDRECAVCHYDLHLSAASCPCDNDRFSCLLHVKDLCGTCDWSERVFMYRYEIGELEVLCEAVSGKLSAVHKWGLSDLRLSLRDCIAKDVKKEVKCENKEVKKESGEKGGVKKELKCENGGKNLGNVGCKEERNEMKCENAVKETQKDILPFKESEKETLPAVLLPFKETQKEIPPAVFLPLKETQNEILPAGGNLKAELKETKVSNGDVASSQNNTHKEFSPLNQHQVLSNSMILEAKKNENEIETLNIPSANSERELSSNNSQMVFVSNNNINNNNQSVVVALTCTNDIKIKRNNKNKGGPRVANVVRKFNCTVEILDYGVILSGNKWSNSRAIFPKGYKSRVKYHSVIDPTQMCFYISEILDGGDLGPLFMVRVEEFREEVFIHTSCIKCWEMVRERVNLEIRRRNMKARTDPTTHLLPPGSLDGLEMFGLTSPDVIKVIEALDRNHVCVEYWSSGQNSIQEKTTETLNLPTVVSNPNLVALKGLLKKANGEEIQALREILSNDASSKTRQETILFLHEESEKLRHK